MLSGNAVPPPSPIPMPTHAVTDAHVHVVSDDTGRFPRRPLGLGRDWWTDRPVDGSAVLADLDDAGVDRAVVVQAVGAYGHDNRYARSVVDADPDRLAFVPSVDTDGDDPAVELQVQTALGPVAGVRLFGVHAEPAWLHDRRGRGVWELAADQGITIVPTVFADHLAAVRALVDRVPGALVALDHCAFPDLRSGPPYPDATELFALADAPSVHLKITSLVLLDAARHGGTVPFIERLVDAFGADRLCWGSDHPQTVELRYPEMLAMANDAFRTIDQPARRSLFDGTARRLFWPEPA